MHFNNQKTEVCEKVYKTQLGTKNLMTRIDHYYDNTPLPYLSMFKFKVKFKALRI